MRSLQVKVGVLEAVQVTNVKRDDLRQCTFGLSPLRRLTSGSQTNPLKGQRPRPRMHGRNSQHSKGKHAVS